MTIKIKTLGLCVAACFLLCLAQVVGNTALILGALVLFLLILGWECLHGCILPVLLFFLPWSALLRTSTNSISAYSVGLVLVCVMTLIRCKFDLRRRDIVVGLLLGALTMVSKLLDGNSLKLSYIAFMMLIVMLPSLKRENEQNAYDFATATVFLSVGSVLAALAAQLVDGYPNIQSYITIHSYLNITRRCGFCSDPNFYSAQITAALGGVMLLTLHSDRRQMVWLMLLAVLLTYCGLLSGSKSFVLVLAVEIVLWIFLLLWTKRTLAFKLTILLSMAVLAIIALSTEKVQNLIEVILTRFSYSDSLDSLTTNRITVWGKYISEILKDPKILLIGVGLSDVLIGEKASHNTIIQMVFQLGLVGSAILVWWWTGLEDRPLLRQVRQEKKVLEMVLLAIGIFLPWMALDLMFFDEFFLFTWYFLLGVADLAKNTSVDSSSTKTE